MGASAPIDDNPADDALINDKSASRHRTPFTDDDRRLSELGWRASRGEFFNLEEELFLGRMMRLNRENPSIAASKRADMAKRCLADANKRLVFKMALNAYKSYSRNTERDDVVAAANVGMARALQDYDDKRGFKFSSYAVWWIRHYIQRIGYKTERVANLPESRINIMRSVRRETLVIEERGENVTPEIMHDILTQHGIDEAEYRKICSFDSMPYSMESPVYDDDTVQASDVMRQDLISSSVMGVAPAAPEDEVAREDVLSVLGDLMNQLSPVQRQLVSMSFLEGGPMSENGEKHRTKTSIRRDLGLDRKNADRELNNAMSFLRDGLMKRGYSYDAVEALY